MWARVKASQVVEIINGAKAMTIDGTQYPASIFRIWSAADLKAKGLYSYSETGHKDTFYYNMGAISYTVDDDAGTVVGAYASTAKGMDDVKWTSKEISDGDAPTGATTDTVKTKASAINAKKIENNSNSKSRDRVFISPLARRIAKKQGIDINLISGTGPHGRIIKKDLAPEINFPFSKTCILLYKSSVFIFVSFSASKLEEISTQSILSPECFLY